MAPTAPTLEVVTKAASKQHGVLSFNELLALGLAGTEIERWVKNRKLKPQFRGVYAVGLKPLTMRGNWMAAVKMYQDKAAISHGSAAQLWGLREPQLPIEVMIPRGSGTDAPGVHAYQTRHFELSDVTEIDGIPVTTMPRTLQDLGSTEGSRRVKELAIEARDRGILDVAELRAMFQTNKNRHGSPAIRAILKALDADAEAREAAEAEKSTKRSSAKKRKSPAKSKTPTKSTAKSNSSAKGKSRAKGAAKSPKKSATKSK